VTRLSVTPVKAGEIPASPECRLAHVSAANGAGDVSFGATIMTEPVDEARWREIDQAIFSHQILRAILSTKEEMRSGIDEAMRLVHQRYERLRAKFPCNFSVGPDEYWAGFYS